MANDNPTSKGESAQPTFLAIGLDAVASQAFKSLPCAGSLLTKGYDLADLAENPVNPPPRMIFCGQPPEGTSLPEVAQCLRMNYPLQPIYYLTSSRAEFDRWKLQKNGFTDVYLLPFDQEVLGRTVRESLAQSADIAQPTYRSVKLIDIEPGAQLGFDAYVFLPMNKKYVLYASGEDSLEQERADRLKKSQIGAVHVPLDQMKRFYQYTARKLKSLAAGKGMSATEREERLRGAVRDLFSSMFRDSSKESTFDAGKTLVSDCKEIVRAYLVEGNPSEAQFYERLLASAEEQGQHTHAVQVSAYAALFSLALGIGDAEEIAMAALLHDIGLAEVPAEIQNIPKEKRTAEQREAYQKHPEISVKLIKASKMIIPEPVIRMIAQHHEQYNGRGYPKGLEGARILPEAQLLAIADEFEELTAIVQGKPRVSPVEALEFMAKRAAGDPTLSPHAPALIHKLLALLKSQSPKTEAEAA